MGFREASDADGDARAFGRLKLGIPAALETLHGRKHVRIVDLSLGGALILLPQPFAVRDCVLQWLGMEAFASIAWQRETRLGVTFEVPLPMAMLMRTREFAPALLLREELEAEEVARGWAAGTVHLGGER